MRVLIIIPTYNERDNIETLVSQIHEALPVADVLIVDDNSPDGTGQLADSLSDKDPRLKVLHREGKLGLGTAYLAGFRHALEAGYDYVFEMDADFSHDPCYLPALLAAVSDEDGADLVIGSRRIPGGGTENWGLGRQLLSSGGSLYARLILGLGQPAHPLGLPVNDLTSGFKWLTYRAMRRGFRVAEVPIVFVDRRAGQSKMSFRIFLEAMGVVWRLRLQDA
jgi:dolichol-phosphate mannosyltransferase